MRHRRRVSVGTVSQLFTFARTRATVMAWDPNKSKYLYFPCVIVIYLLLIMSRTCVTYSFFLNVTGMPQIVILVNVSSEIPWALATTKLVSYVNIKNPIFGAYLRYNRSIFVIT